MTRPTRGSRSNTTAFRAKINVLLCPSDLDRLTNVFGHSNYYGNSGNAPEGIFDNHRHGACNGLFASVNHEDGTPNVKPVSFRDITDGLSQTAAFSERVKGHQQRLHRLRPGAADLGGNERECRLYRQDQRRLQRRHPERLLRRLQGDEPLPSDG